MRTIAALCAAGLLGGAVSMAPTFAKASAFAEAPADRRSLGGGWSARQAASAPKPEHGVLKALEGRWSREITFTMGGGQKFQGTGSAMNRMILGGRFLQSDQLTTTPPLGTTPAATIETMTIYGFDTRTKEFTLVELDSMGSYWVTASGARTDPNLIVMSGETLDDHGGARDVRRYDMTLRIVDANTYVTQVIFKFENKPALTFVEAVHRRIK